MQQLRLHNVVVPRGHQVKLPRQGQGPLQGVGQDGVHLNVVHLACIGPYVTHRDF